MMMMIFSEQINMYEDKVKKLKQDLSHLQDINAQTEEQVRDEIIQPFIFFVIIFNYQGCPRL